MNNRIREIRKSRNLTQDELAEKIGAVKSQVSKLETGGLNLNQHWIEKISKALQCSPGELISDIENPLIYVLGEVPGPDFKSNKEPIGLVRFPTKGGNKCALRVRGKSMNMIAADGAYVIVDLMDNNPDSLENQPIIVCIDGECKLKIFRKQPDRLEAYTTEIGYDTIFLNLQNWQIYGRVIGTIGFIGPEGKLD